MEERTIGEPSKIVRIGGYLVAGGALAGFSLGVYLLFNSTLFTHFIHIGQFEVTSYFVGVFVPSFIVLIVIGYLFATTSGLKRVNLSNVALHSVLSLLCMILSALSVFYLSSFFGGFLVLAALVKAYTESTFKTLSKREALFLVEIGSLFLAAFATLFFLMGLMSDFFQTYAMGSHRGYSLYALLLVVVLSFLVFFAISLMDSRGANVGLCGALGLVMSIISCLFIIQNRYAFSNAPAYLGVFMLVAGFVLALVGDLIYLKLFFSKPAPLTSILTSSILYRGKYCPYCGTSRASLSQSWCYHCRRSLMWAPYAPYCSSCGRLIPTNAQTCPHCQEDIRSKRIHFYEKGTQK